MHALAGVVPPAAPRDGPGALHRRSCSAAGTRSGTRCPASATTGSAARAPLFAWAAALELVALARAPRRLGAARLGRGSRQRRSLSVRAPSACRSTRKSSAVASASVSASCAWYCREPVRSRAAERFSAAESAGSSAARGAPCARARRGGPPCRRPAATRQLAARSGGTRLQEARRRSRGGGRAGRRRASAPLNLGQHLRERRRVLQLRPTRAGARGPRRVDGGARRRAGRASGSASPSRTARRGSAPCPTAMIGSRPRDRARPSRGRAPSRRRSPRAASEKNMVGLRSTSGSERAARPGSARHRAERLLQAAPLDPRELGERGTPSDGGSPCASRSSCEPEPQPEQEPVRLGDRAATRASGSPARAAASRRARVPRAAPAGLEAVAAGEQDRPARCPCSFRSTAELRRAAGAGAAAAA